MKLKLFKLFIVFYLIFINIHLVAQPNIVLILADDLGYGDLSCYNSQSKILTPHIDTLANNGIQFTDAHSSSSVCTPSRYSILTGRYCWRTTLKRSVFFNYEPPLIDTNMLTIASMLQNKGYETACIGKWHLGIQWQIKSGEQFDFDRPFPWTSTQLTLEEESKIDFSNLLLGGPTALGFDYFFGSSSSPTCTPPYAYIENNKLVSPPTIYYEGKYMEQRNGFRSPDWLESEVDSIFTDKAVKFITNSASNKKPFFLYFSSSAPHEPCEKAVLPSFIRDISGAGSRGDMVVFFDWMVGQIVSTLSQNGVLENTLIIVTSDNGAKPGDYNQLTYGHKSNGNLRGFKGGIWEGGHRVPLIISWQNKLPKGVKTKQLVGLQDILATTAEILNISVPIGMAEDSHSFIEKDESTFKLKGRKELIHHSEMGVFSIRSGNWKLIVNSDNSGDYGRNVHRNDGSPPVIGMKGQLYNLEKDPFEYFNLIDEQSDKANELHALLKSIQGSSTGRSFDFNYFPILCIGIGLLLSGLTWNYLIKRHNSDSKVRDIK